MYLYICTYTYIYICIYIYIYVICTYRRKSRICGNKPKPRSGRARQPLLWRWPGNVYAACMYRDHKGGLYIKTKLFAYSIPFDDASRAVLKNDSSEICWSIIWNHGNLTKKLKTYKPTDLETYKPTTLKI